MRHHIRALLFITLSIIFLSSISFAIETRGLSVVAKDPSSGKQGEVKLYNKSYAVIIGIDKYTNLPPTRQLKYAVKDAKGIEEVLRSKYRFDRIITLYNEQATRDNILRLFMDDLPAEMSEEDSLLVFWAGHGNQEKTRTGDIGYLIPYNGIPNKLYTNISMTELKENISKKIPAKHVFFVMDACYSGLLTATRAVDKSPRRDLAYLQEITKETVRQVLTAGSKGQEVLDGGRKGHSVFTGRLIEVLDATGDFITANEIQSIIREKVYGDARARNHVQTPDFGTLYGNGDFVFIPNIEKKVEDSKAEIAKIQEELKRLDASENAARKSSDERKQREARDQIKIAEAKLKAEQLRQQQLQEEERLKKGTEEDRAKFEAEQRKRELELSGVSKDEEKRLVALKAELDRKKKAASVAPGGDNIEAAVAEIKSLNTRINEIESTFQRQFSEGKIRITKRYDDEIAVASRDLKNLQPLSRDEFETRDEFSARETKRKAGYEQRIRDLEKKKQGEIGEFQKRINDEQAKQTAELRTTLNNIANKEYTIDAEDIVMELGMYDVENQRFPVTLKNKTVTETFWLKGGKKEHIKIIPKPAGILVAVKGIIPLPKDEARKFKQGWQNGLVRPIVTARTNSDGYGEIIRVALADDTDGDLMVSDNNGEFFSKIKSAVASRDGRFIAYFNGTVSDTRTNLMWAAKDNGRDINWADAKSYCENYRGGSYTDWRMPTQDELAALYTSGAHENKIKLTNNWVWASETRGSEAAIFRFGDGLRDWFHQSVGNFGRTLPVRFGK